MGRDPGKLAIRTVGWALIVFALAITPLLVTGEDGLALGCGAMAAVLAAVFAAATRLPASSLAPAPTPRDRAPGGATSLSPGRS